MTKIIQKYKDRKAAKIAAREAAQLATVRTPQDIQKEYHGTCAELGDKKYKAQVLEVEMKNLTDRLYALNQEFHRASQVYAQANANKPAPAAQAPVAQAPQEQNAQA